eukprot:COSAG04_NODE_12015_length_675_cov_2.237847_1_plen_62_part_01
MGKKRRRAEAASADPDAGLDGGDFSLAGGAPGLDDLGTGLWFDDAAAASSCGRRPPSAPSAR